MDLNMDTDALKGKLEAAAERFRLRYLVTMTIRENLSRGKVSPDGAMEWIRQEGLLAEIQPH